MDKPTPLKNKLISKLKKGTGGYAGKGIRGMYAEDKDIKSAVEWLKEQLDGGFGLNCQQYRKYIKKKLNQAFEDII